MNNYQNFNQAQFINNNMQNQINLNNNYMNPNSNNNFINFINNQNNQNYNFNNNFMDNYNNLNFNMNNFMNFMNNQNNQNYNMNNNFMNNQYNINMNQNNFNNMNVNNNQNMNYLYQMNLLQNNNFQNSISDMVMETILDYKINLAFKNEKKEDSNKIYEDIFPYINEEKINIIFITFNNQIIKLKIPTSLTKNELYYTAANYKRIDLTKDIKLYHNKKLLDNDESSINSISNYDIIVIIEPINFDNSHLLNYNNSNIINLKFITGSGFKFRNSFPNDITIDKMIEIMRTQIKKDIIFLKDGSKLQGNKLLKDSINEKSEILILSNKSYFNINVPGKPLKATIIYKTKKIRINKAGTLQQIKDFYKNLMYTVDNKISGKPLIYPEEIELEPDDERTFSSIGIRHDFTCLIDLNGDIYFGLVDQFGSD